MRVRVRRRADPCLLILASKESVPARNRPSQDPLKCSMKKQVHVYYSGSVQGVGFRFTARSIAEELGVLGWAKNLRDARVEMVS